MYYSLQSIIDNKARQSLSLSSSSSLLQCRPTSYCILHQEQTSSRKKHNKTCTVHNVVDYMYNTSPWNADVALNGRHSNFFNCTMNYCVFYISDYFHRACNKPHDDCPDYCCWASKECLKRYYPDVSPALPVFYFNGELSI